MYYADWTLARANENRETDMIRKCASKNLK